MNIAVYCGSSDGNSPLYRESAEALGRWIAENGHTMVYGGGRRGLMGAAADAALQAGGRVIGVIPDFLATTEQLHTGLTELIPVRTMGERKAKMIERSDVFTALPGGVGTLEELSEILSRIHLNLTEPPLILFDPNGFYEPLRQMLDRMARCDFYSADPSRRLVSVRDTDALEAELKARGIL